MFNPIHYCQPCAQRFGWPFAPDNRCSSRECSVCRRPGDGRTVSPEVDVRTLPPPLTAPGLAFSGPFTPGLVALARFQLLDAARKRLQEAWGEMLKRVGDHAAEAARLEAVQAAGHYIDPRMGFPRPEDQERRMRDEAQQATHDWVVAFAAFQEVVRLREQPAAVEFPAS